MRQLFPTCESPIEITLTRNVVGLAPPDDDADDDERFDDVPLIAMRARMQQTEFGTELGHIVAPRVRPTSSYRSPRIKKQLAIFVS